MMKILLSNDDGYMAPGIVCLYEALTSVAEVTLVAPDRNRSAASSSLTLDLPLRVHEAEAGIYRVDGTPTDCVHLALTGLLSAEPDMVVSGINDSANMGDDVIYSGTVAAAIEGRFLGYPAIAVSMVGVQVTHYATAARVLLALIQQVKKYPFPSDVILNVNVPDLPFDALKGFQSTRLGCRHKAESVIQSKDPRGATIYWVGPPGDEEDAGPGTDFHAVANHFVSVTPLQIDLTRHNMLADLADWLKEI